MAHPSHVEDTLFIVCESDFIFHEQDEETCKDWVVKQASLSSKIAHLEELAYLLEDIEERQQFIEALNEYKEAVKSDINAPWPLPKNAKADAVYSNETVTCEHDGQTDAVSEFAIFKEMKKLNENEAQEECCAPELLDLISYATAAHRHQRGGFIWASWNAAHWYQNRPWRKQSPTTGAQCCLVTTACARKLLPLWTATPDMHMGRMLREFVGNKWQDEIGSCYLYPPVGGFWTHESTTSPGRVLQSQWKQSWAQSGTRPMKPGDIGRKIGMFTKKGPAQWVLEDIHLPRDTKMFRWYTEKVPSMPDALCGWWDHLSIEPYEDSRLYL